MSTIPIRATVLTAAGTNIYDIMAAMCADIDANSTWTITNHDETTTPVGLDGSFAMTLRSPDGTQELNFLNSGTKTSPSATTIRQGINPDGSADPITDATSPSASAANFSGTDDGYSVAHTIGNVEFILLEWDHSIMVLFKDSTKARFTGSIYFGKTMLNPLSSLEDTATLKLDGNIIWSSMPTHGIAYAWVGGGNSGPHIRRRIADGNSVGSASSPDINHSWSQPYYQHSLMSGARSLSYPQAFTYGPSNEKIAWPVSFHARDNVAYADSGWIARHLRYVPPTMPPLSVWKSGGVAQYMVLGMTTANFPLAVVIPSGFDPTP